MQYFVAHLLDGQRAFLIGENGESQELPEFEVSAQVLAEFHEATPEFLQSEFKRAFQEMEAGIRSTSQAHTHTGTV